MMLMCDEVLIICKIIWEGIKFMNFKISVIGWMDFFCSYFLEEGDVCMFEFFNNIIVCIGVYIFCVVELRRL